MHHKFPLVLLIASFLLRLCTLFYDFKAANNTCHRILKKGGVLLLTSPGITPLDQGEWKDTWCWSFTLKSLRRLIEESFPSSNVSVETFGNAYVAAAFLYGDASKNDIIVPIGFERDKIFYPPQLLISLYPLGKAQLHASAGFYLKKKRWRNLVVLRKILKECIKIKHSW
jgi:hypothetical protein